MTKPRRKKKYMLLRGKFNNYIVVERTWYDSKGIGRARGRNQSWFISAESDDPKMLSVMGGLAGNLVNQQISNKYE